MSSTDYPCPIISHLILKCQLTHLMSPISSVCCFLDDCQRSTSIFIIFFLAALHISPRGFYFNIVYFIFMRKGRYNTKFGYAKQCFLAFIPGFVLLTFKSWTLVPSRWFSKQAYMELQSLPWVLPENLPDKIHSSDADFYRVAQPSPLGSNFLSRRPGLPEGNSTHIF